MNLSVDTDNASDVHTLQMAAAVLFVEVMEADHEVHEKERNVVLKAIRATFDMDEAEALELMQKAESYAQQTASLHQFISILNEELSEEEKINLLVQIWHIVYADDELDKYEEHLVRRIAELLYIRHKDFIRAKHQAQS